METADPRPAAPATYREVEAYQIQFRVDDDDHAVTLHAGIWLGRPSVDAFLAVFFERTPPCRTAGEDLHYNPAQAEAIRARARARIAGALRADGWPEFPAGESRRRHLFPSDDRVLLEIGALPAVFGPHAP